MNANNTTSDLPADATPQDVGTDDTRPLPDLNDWWLLDDEGYTEAIIETCADLLPQLIADGLSVSYPGRGYANVGPMVKRMQPRLDLEVGREAAWVVKWRAGKSEENAD